MSDLAYACFVLVPLLQPRYCWCEPRAHRQHPRRPGRTGVLVPPGDLHAVFRAVDRMLSNDEHRATLSRAGVARVDVYAEVAGTVATVYVRDRGRGFDSASVADDRMGIRTSIMGRMERHGGTANVQSAPGDGTEITLTMGVGE